MNVLLFRECIDQLFNNTGMKVSLNGMFSRMHHYSDASKCVNECIVVKILH